MRSKVQHDGLCCEVDEFRGKTSRLVAAEVELTAADQEVTDDPSYFSSRLAMQPYE